MVFVNLLRVVEEIVAVERVAAGLPDAYACAAASYVVLEHFKLV